MCGEPERASRRARHQGGDRHVRLDRFCPADPGRQGRPVQEAGARCRDQDDPAERPPPGAGRQGHPVRGHHRGDPRRLEHQRRAHRADRSARQVLRRRRHRGARRHQGLCRPQGQDHRRRCARHRALLRPGLDAEQERHEPEGCENHHAQPAGRCAGFRGWPERRRHDLRALPLQRAREPAGGQDPGHHAGLPDGDGHAGLRA